MNEQLFWFYIAVGALSKLATLRNSSPGDRLAAVATIVAGAGLSGYVIPVEANPAVFWVLGVFHASEVVGRFLSVAIDKARIKVDRWWRGRRARPAQ